jgi:hypothetical protein
MFEILTILAGTDLMERKTLYGKPDRTASEKLRCTELGSLTYIAAKFSPEDIAVNSPWMIAIALWPRPWKVCVLACTVIEFVCLISKTRLILLQNPFAQEMLGECVQYLGDSFPQVLIDEHFDSVLLVPDKVPSNACIESLCTPVMPC